VAIRRMLRAGTVALMLGGAAACGSGGGLGNVLGSVLGGGTAQPSTVSGTVVNVSQSQITLQLQDGQQVALAYDQQTTVVYQNRSYQVANLERGDQVTVQVQDQGNGAYYVSAVQVDQSIQGGGTVNGGTTGGTNSVQSIQGTVRQIDQQNGLFTLDAGNGSIFTVALPYNVSRADSDRFRALRSGDRVRFYGVVLNNTRIELRQFY
jgi:tRNA(Ile2) C34 agmatinyltransferase TiaS